MSSSAHPHHSNHKEDEEAMPAWPIEYETTNERFDVAWEASQHDNSNSEFVDDSWGVPFSYPQPTDFDTNAQHEDEYADMYMQWPPMPESDDVHGMRADGLSLQPWASLPLDHMLGAEQHDLVRAVSPSPQPWARMAIDPMLGAHQPDQVRAVSPPSILPSSQNELSPSTAEAAAGEDSDLTQASAPRRSSRLKKKVTSQSHVTGASAPRQSSRVRKPSTSQSHVTPASPPRRSSRQKKTTISPCEVNKDSRFVRDGQGQWSNNRCTKQAIEHEGLPKSLRWCNGHTHRGYPYLQLMTGKDPRQLWTELTTDEKVDVVIGLLDRVGRSRSKDASSLLRRAQANRPAITLVVEESTYPDLSRLPWVPEDWSHKIGDQEIEANPNNARLSKGTELLDDGTMDSNDTWGPSHDDEAVDPSAPRPPIVRRKAGAKKKVRDRCEVKRDPLFVTSHPGHWTDGRCVRDAVDHRRLPKSLRWCQQHTRAGYPYKQLMTGEDPHRKWPQLTTDERVKVFKVLIDSCLASTRDPTLERVLSDSGEYSGALTRAAEQEPYPDLSIHSWLPACWRSAKSGRPKGKNNAVRSSGKTRRVDSDGTPDDTPLSDHDGAVNNDEESLSDSDEATQGIEGSAGSTDSVGIIQDTIVVQMGTDR